MTGAGAAGAGGGRARAEAITTRDLLPIRQFSNVVAHRRSRFYRLADLYDKDKVDIEHVSMEDVFVLLQCDDKGLTEEEAVRRIGIFGPNKVRGC
jgi:hypothetical protein